MTRSYPSVVLRSRGGHQDWNVGQKHARNAAARHATDPTMSNVAMFGRSGAVVKCKRPRHLHNQSIISLYELRCRPLSKRPYDDCATIGQGPQRGRHDPHAACFVVHRPHGHAPD